MEDWIKRAKKRMKMKGLTQKDVAASMGKTTGGAVGHYFTGRSTPNLKQLRGLAEKLGLSFSMLVDGHDVVDEDLLDECLQLVEQAELDSGINLTAKQSAKMVTYLYKASQKGAKINSQNAQELIKLYA